VTLGRAMVLTLVLPRSAETEQARILGQDTLERSRRVLGPPDHPITLHAGTALGWLGEAERPAALPKTPWNATNGSSAPTTQTHLPQRPS
jgi:hypothetical protein